VIAQDAAKKTLSGIRHQVNALQSMFGRVPAYKLIRPSANAAYKSTLVGELEKLQRGDIVKVDFSVDSEIVLPANSAKR
jgi:hypothetical protein